MSTSTPSARSLYFLVPSLLTFEPTSSLQIADDSGEVWAAIGGEADSVPHHTARGHRQGWVDDEQEVRPPSLAGPDWSGKGKDYLAFGVDLEKVHDRLGAVTIPWMHSFFTHEDEYLDPDDRSRIHPQLLTKIKKDLRVARDLVALLDRRGGSTFNVIDRLYSGEEVGFADGSPAVLRELRVARRVMDQRLAAINFALLRAEPSVLTYVKLTYGAYIKKWHLLAEMRGIYVDFETFNPRVTHLLDFIQKGVPVYYPLDLEYCPRLTENETRLAESLRTPEDFAYAFLRAHRGPRVRKTENAPRKPFGSTLEDEVAEGLPRPAKGERMGQLARYASLILTDALHSDLAPIVPLPEEASFAMVEEARLVLESLTELRLMHWAAKWRVTDVREILSEALLRGWTFHVVYPTSVLDKLVQEEEYAADAHLDQLTPLVTCVNMLDFDASHEWAKFERAVDSLLSRPHAYAFLFEGGFIWRLAMFFGGPRVPVWLKRILKPSAKLVLRRTEPSHIPDHWGDVVSETEKNTLLGLCVCRDTGVERYWFPSPEQLIEHRFHDGQWTFYEEHFLQERVGSLRRGEGHYRPLTPEEWDTELSSYLPGRLLRDSFVPIDGPSTDALLADARIEFGGPWNLLSLRELNNSLVFEDEASEI
ncbi:hypothetical protein BC629DRAFT_1439388 [Irpex lacteus]|nr:hypothetical protein BC629DRAFT_1439388 [Irpex lacteus]